MPTVIRTLRNVRDYFFQLLVTDSPLQSFYSPLTSFQAKGNCCQVATLNSSAAALCGIAATSWHKHDARFHMCFNVSIKPRHHLFPYPRLFLSSFNINCQEYTPHTSLLYSHIFSFTWGNPTAGWWALAHLVSCCEHSSGGQGRG